MLRNKMQCVRWKNVPRVAPVMRIDWPRRLKRARLGRAGVAVVAITQQVRGSDWVRDRLKRRRRRVCAAESPGRTGKRTGAGSRAGALREKDCLWSRAELDKRLSWIEEEVGPYPRSETGLPYPVPTMRLAIPGPDKLLSLLSSDSPDNINIPIIHYASST